jgi:predicted transposase YbfD/YdcC
MSGDSKKYVCTKETLKKTLKKYGVAIIPSVLDFNECKLLVSGIWDFLEHITHDWNEPIKRTNKKSWKGFYDLFPLHSMLLQHWGVGHAQVSWNVRQNKKIVEIFAHFWKCEPEELLVSFDGLSFSIPPEVTKKGWNRGNTWYHTDQSYVTPDFKCIQSWISGLDTNNGDATLSLMEGSHKFHNEFREHFNITDKANWYKLTKEQEQFYKDKGCEYKNIECPKGSLVLWDSRTIHCGIEPNKDREAKNFRAVIYLCYMPRSLCSDANLKKKQTAFTELRTTSHYPCDIKLFPKTPRTYGSPIPDLKNINVPIINDLGKKLAGF